MGNPSPSFWDSFLGTINKFHVYINNIFANIKKEIHILKLNENEVGTILLEHLWNYKVNSSATSWIVYSRHCNGDMSK